MKCSCVVLLCVLILAGCNERTVGGPVGTTIPYEYGTYHYSEYEWIENASNKLVYNISGKRNGLTDKIYVDFRYNGLQVSAISRNVSRETFCQIQLYAMDGSMIGTVRVDLSGTMTFQEQYVYSRQIAYLVFDFSGNFGETQFVLESYAR